MARAGAKAPAGAVQSNCTLWVASLVQDPHLTALLQLDLNRRVLDAENVGFSYGVEVERSQGYSPKKQSARSTRSTKQQSILTLMETSCWKARAAQAKLRTS